MKNLALIFFVVAAAGCSKHSGTQTDSEFFNAGQLIALAEQGKVASFQAYTIQKGAHYADQRPLKAVFGTSLNFTVRFDSSAIYPAVVTDYNHALDANKLWGFSEGADNQQNSARIGWRWYNNKLQLLAYVHKNGQVLRDPVSYDPPIIKAVKLGEPIACSIAVSGYEYVFTVDGVTRRMPRAINTASFSGLQQYPYFGGTLVAPHRITIYVK